MLIVAVAKMFAKKRRTAIFGTQGSAHTEYAQNVAIAYPYTKYAQNRRIFLCTCQIVLFSSKFS
jgi:hypothetical protein